MDVTNCPELSSSSFLHISIDTLSSFIWATPLRGEATRHVITYLSAYFAIMRTPNSVKTDNGPAYISRQFKQFLYLFSIKQISHSETTNKNLKKGGNTHEHCYLPYLEHISLDSRTIYFLSL